MKNFLKSIGVLIFGALLLCTGAYVCTSCQGNDSIFGSKDGVTKEYVDSTVAVNIQNYVNPLFDSVDEVLKFKQLSIEGTQIDEEFNNLPENVLKTIAGVCIQREGHVSKRGIVYEYRAHADVYKNLPKDATSVPETDKQAPDSSKKESTQVTRAVPQGETRFNQYDTVINGKTYKMRTKTEITYE